MRKKSNEHFKHLRNIFKKWRVYDLSPEFWSKKVPILYTSPKFHPYNEVPRQSPKFKILDCKHWVRLLPLLGSIGLYVLNIHFFIELVLNSIFIQNWNHNSKQIVIIYKSRIFIQNKYSIFKESKKFIQNIVFF